MVRRLCREIELLEGEGELTGLPSPPVGYVYNDIRLFDTKPIVEHRLAAKEVEPLFIPRQLVIATILSYEPSSV
jgi:hypothetical protein